MEDKKERELIDIIIGLLAILIVVIMFTFIYTYNCKQQSVIAKLEIDNMQLKASAAEKDNQIIELTNQFNYVVQNKATDVQALFKSIEPLKKENKQSYLRWYKAIYSQYNNVLDPSETIYDYTSDDEFKLICEVVQAEIGNGNFNQKCNIASVIINRYYSKSFPNNWKDILFQKDKGTYQFSSVGNGAYKRVIVDNDTVEAIEYAFMIEDTTNGATYFHSGRSLWHERNLHFIFSDGKHKFYKVKEKK